MTARQSARSLRSAIRQSLPRPLLELLRLAKHRQDIPDTLRFLAGSRAGLGAIERAQLVARLYRITMSIECAHTQSEILLIFREIFNLPASVRGVLVEAGCFKGGSTAKISLAARHVGRLLYVFDSFEGIPAHDEAHDKNIFGESAGFPEGSYAGTYDEVVGNVRRTGAVEPCRFVKGWFDDTLPAFHEPVAFAYLDVDLASSTRTCLRHLYPLLSPGGVIISQDGHLPLVLEVLRDEGFWQREVGCLAPPTMEGLGVSKIVCIRKPQ
jgi:O-methyltransferase